MFIGASHKVMVRNLVLQTIYEYSKFDSYWVLFYCDHVPDKAKFYKYLIYKFQLTSLWTL